jgi:addiction module RelE/StbE family toxin
MTYKIVFLPAADEDLDNIEAYLSQFYASTVSKFYQELEKKLEGLEQNPRMYPLWQDNPLYRKLNVKGYLVFYKVFDACQTVEVQRILFGGRNIAPDLGSGSA